MALSVSAWAASIRRTRWIPRPPASSKPCASCAISRPRTQGKTCYNHNFKPVRKTQEKSVMPKLKTHKGASKRFKKTGTGKVVRGHAFARHILTSKARKRKRKLHKSVVADETDQQKLQRMIP